MTQQEPDDILSFSVHELDASSWPDSAAIDLLHLRPNTFEVNYIPDVGPVKQGDRVRIRDGDRIILEAIVKSVTQQEINTSEDESSYDLVLEKVG